MLATAVFSLLSKAGASGKLSILAFHKIPRSTDPLVPDELCLDQFEQLLAFLAEHFRLLPLSEAAHLLAKGKLPARASAITFDDGYGEWHAGVTAVLHKYRAPATFFITTSQLNGEPLWHERVIAAVRALPQRGARMPAGMEAVSDRSSDDARRDLLVRLLRRLKYCDLESRGRIIRELEAEATMPLHVAAPFTSEQLVELRRQGFDIGSHTVSHPILSNCSSAQVRQELGESRDALESILREPVRMFAYTNGRPNIDYGPEHVSMVKAAGYNIAVSMGGGVASGQCDVLQLPRFTPWGRSRWRIALQLARNMTAEPAVARAKRVLMVAFHFPPQAGSSGVLRSINFVKRLPGHGWHPFVLSAHPRAYDERRDDLVQMVPSGVGVVRAFALDAAQHLAILKKYPRLLALPDRWSSWALGGLFAGLHLARRERPDVLWSTSPIPTAHLIAAGLARLTGLPWTADFRDPMVKGDYPPDPLQRRICDWLEAYVLRHATYCVFTTERAAQLYKARYPAAAPKILVIENGYDEDVFQGTTPLRSGVKDDVLLLVHSGIIYPQERSPAAFFKAVTRLIAAGNLDPTKLCIRFRAPYHVEEITRLARLHDLERVVEVAPPIPYREAIAEMLGADLLLLFQGKDFNAQVPAKIYEYLRSMRPLLALIDPAGDTALTLRQFTLVLQARIDDADDIARGLEQWLTLRRDPTTAVLLQENLPAVRRYSRAVQAEKLSGLLNLSMNASLHTDRAFAGL